MKTNFKIKIILLMVVCSVLNTFSQGTQKSISFELKVDPRVELINTVLTFTKWPYYGKIDEPDYTFIQELKEYFSFYREHEAVKWCNDFPYFRDISFPPQMVIYLTDPPIMKLNYKIPIPLPEEEFKKMLRTIDLLNQFSKDSKFMDFWKSKQSFYKSMLKKIEDRLPYDNYLKIVQDFYGKSSTKFVCIISPTLPGIGFGAQLITDEGTIPHFIAGTNEYDKGIPVFTDEWLRLLIFHEFGHAYVNPLCERYKEEINKYESLLQYFTTNPYIKKIYNEWFVVCHENMVRAGEYILLKKAGLEKESEKNLLKNLDYGYALIPFFIEKLEYYNNNRDLYPSFESYFPEMLKVFDEVRPVEYMKPLDYGFSGKLIYNQYIIKKINKDSPCILEGDGLEVNDIVISINSVKIDDKKSLNKAIDQWENSRQGEKITFEILRNEEKKHVQIEVPFIKTYRFEKK